MRISDYILKRLSEAGIDTAFVVYGGAISELMDAFTRQDKVRYVVTIHEQAAGFAAEGYAKAKGIPGCAIATSGPGGGNLVTPIQDCFYDSTPAIFITGQVQSRFIRPTEQMRQLGFQETPIVDIVMPITKWAYCVTNPQQIAWAMDNALRICKSGRPGPVLLDIPIDVQKTEISEEHLARAAQYEPPLEPPAQAVSACLVDLAEAKRPAILVGGGAYKARHAIERFAHSHAIPVFRTWNAQDIVTDDMPIYGGTVGTYGGPGRNFGIQNCDLLLALGCRFSGRITGGMPETFARGAKKYIVDVDPVALDATLQQVHGDVNVHANAQDFANLLQHRYSLAPNTPVFIDWLRTVREWLTRYDPVRTEMFTREVHHYAFVRRLSEMLPANAIIVSDTGGNVIMMGHAFRSKKGQRIFSSNGNTPMGFALCGAIGAWFAEPTRPIICIIGDGGMQMNIQELQTIKHYGIPIKVFIINNKTLGNTKSYQRVNGMKEVACGPDGYSVPDFVDLTVAYGIKSFHVPAMHYMDYMIPDILKETVPCVCDVIHDDFCQYEPRISEWDVGIEDSYPFLPRQEFRDNLIAIEPLPGWETKK